MWNQPDVTTTYQWLRSGSAIAGATTVTYTLTIADLGKEISLRATGSKTGFQDSVAVSNAVVATAGGALQATVAAGHHRNRPLRAARCGCTRALVAAVAHVRLSVAAQRRTRPGCHQRELSS